MGILDILTSLFGKKMPKSGIEISSHEEPQSESPATPVCRHLASQAEDVAESHVQGTSFNESDLPLVGSPPASPPATVELRCPYCKEIVTDQPKKKRKCLSCGRHMCVRKLPSGNIRLFTEEQATSLCTRTLPSGERVLVTREEADVIDMQLLEVREQRMAEWWLKEFRFSVPEYKSLREQSKTAGRSAHWRDVIWLMCNARIQGLVAANSYWELKSLYYDMARFCNEDGKDCSHLLRESARAELMRYKSEGATRVEFLAGDCKACRKLDGKKFRINVALETMPLPPANCTCVLKEDDTQFFCKSMWAGAPR